ncbi:MAG: methyltransferase [Zoogloea sp.]|nr:methyltransferase [Zoogloea sp.]
MTWRALTVAEGGTHHLAEGVPAYSERFDEVLKFHAPGLAPVRRQTEAWHIHPDGSPAYSRRFLRAFGFYEALAAVADSDGWHHITPCGADAYPQRYAWCGNCQEQRCSVRMQDGTYLHITPSGLPAYAARWRYVGDFRDGVGVVQHQDGRSTHIRPDGTPLHGAWFLDLDVFHKAYARARDEAGWMHIDRAGKPIYARRFANVEPFYNGQARVERFDGGLEVIDEMGSQFVELRPALRSEFAALSADMVGFWRTETIAAAVELGVFEALPGTATEVAARCELHEDRTLRLFRALGELSLVTMEGAQWRRTPRGEYLRRDHLLTLAGAAGEYAQHFSAMWRSLPDAISRSGQWRAPDVFGEVAQDDTRPSSHHRMLLSYARHDYPAVPAALRLRGNERVVDAGGGLGALSLALLERYPELVITLLDRPEVVDQAQRFLSSEPRIELRAADLFQPWQVSADAVVMARILHDWDDSAAIRILKRVREVLAVGNEIFVIEMVLPETGVAGALCDLHLLMATGGQERTEAGYASIFTAAGFDLVEVRHLPALPSILVGRAR